MSIHDGQAGCSGSRGGDGRADVGSRTMESERYDLVFLALARDCASGASRFIREIQRPSARGLNMMALVGENGSTDDTGSLLLRSDAPIRVIDTSVMDSTRQV
jgi:hypothetical protein